MKPPKLKINRSILLLNVGGVKFDIIEACSEPLAEREFLLNSPGQPPTIKSLWRDICLESRFNLDATYLNGESKFFAYMQTLSNGCVATSLRGTQHYDEIPKSEWLAQGSAYLIKTLGQSDDVLTELYEKALDGDYYKWSRAASGASKKRVFARTAKGYFVLGPKVLEAGDIICISFGGKMPFCLRPWGCYYLLVGECYVHGLMGGEAMKMLDQGKVEEEAFDII
jgi:hypothetical protein